MVENLVHKLSIYSPCWRRTKLDYPTRRCSGNEPTLHPPPPPHEKSSSRGGTRPGARFSKVPIIKEPGKLLMLLQDRGFSSFADNLIKWTCLLAGTCAFISEFWLNIWFRARKVTGTFEKRTLDPRERRKSSLKKYQLNSISKSAEDTESSQKVHSLKQQSVFPIKRNCANHLIFQWSEFPVFLYWRARNVNRTQLRSQGPLLPVPASGRRGPWEQGWTGETFRSLFEIFKWEQRLWGP